MPIIELVKNSKGIWEIPKPSPENSYQRSNLEDLLSKKKEDNQNNPFSHPKNDFLKNSYINNNDPYQ
jgi:hypothetical protein